MQLRRDISPPRKLGVAMSTDKPDGNSSTPGAGSKSIAVLDALRDITAPGQDADIVALGWVRDLSISSGTVHLNLALPPAEKKQAGGVKLQVRQALDKLEWVEKVEIGEANPLPNVKHVLAIGSGKGGVGKSTVSVNLALALAAAGYKTGILDADVYGPSIPLMLGLSGRPMANEEEKIIPLEKHGLKVMSMGFLLNPDQAVVWRGPMVHGVVNQFIGDVVWGELDFLVVDLPPGTGDAPLSLAQTLPLTAAVVVTTPQEVAASVAAKAMSMFQNVGLRILGLIENMSYFKCPHCGETSEIFGRGGGKVLAANATIPLLGEIPIDTRMRKGSDTGEPLMVEFPDSELAGKFREIAARLAKQVEQT
jgi:ATP-binding protein involved in chromosome partitioning